MNILCKNRAIHNIVLNVNLYAKEITFTEMQQIKPKLKNKYYN